MRKPASGSKTKKKTTHANTQPQASKPTNDTAVPLSDNLQYRLGMHSVKDAYVGKEHGSKGAMELDPTSEGPLSPLSEEQSEALLDLVDVIRDPIHGDICSASDSLSFKSW